MILSSKLITLCREVGLWAVCYQLKQILINNSDDRINDSFKTGFQILASQYQNYCLQSFPWFSKLLKQTQKTLKKLRKNNKQLSIHSKVRKLFEELQKFEKKKDKAIIFVSVKYILVNLKIILHKMDIDLKISVALNKKGNKNIVKSLPHQVLLQNDMFNLNNLQIGNSYLYIHKLKITFITHV